MSGEYNYLGVGYLLFTQIALPPNADRCVVALTHEGALKMAYKLFF